MGDDDDVGGGGNGGYGVSKARLLLIKLPFVQNCVCPALPAVS